MVPEDRAFSSRQTDPLPIEARERNFIRWPLNVRRPEIVTLIHSTQTISVAIQVEFVLSRSSALLQHDKKKFVLFVPSIGKLFVALFIRLLSLAP